MSHPLGILQLGLVRPAGGDAGRQLEFTITTRVFMRVPLLREVFLSLCSMLFCMTPL